MLVPGGRNYTVPMQAGATALGDGEVVYCTTNDDGAITVLAMQITGITTATITFEATIDGTNWVAVQATNLNDGSDATTATANGIYRLTCLGLMQVRARVSAYTSGTIYVTGVACA